MDTKQLADEVFGAVRGWMERSILPLAGRVKALEDRPPAVGLNGKDGASGADGKSGADGINGKDGSDGIAGKDGAAGADGQRGVDGINGKDGAAGRDGINGKDGSAGADGVNGKDGPDGAAGKDGEPGGRGEKGDQGDTGPAGKDGAAGDRGEPGDRGPPGADGKDGAPGTDGQRGADGIKGKDGSNGINGDRGELGQKGDPGQDGRDGLEGPPGRDAIQIDVIDGIDGAKRYQRGTYAAWRGGIVKAYKATEPMGDGAEYERCGWQVVVRGISGADWVLSDDMRTFELRLSMTDGQTVAKAVKVPAMIYRGIWKEGDAYERGDTVTRGGSAWVLREEVQAGKPGDDASGWQLAVKAGTPGRDGLKGKDGDRGAEGRPGRDMTQLGFDGGRH